MAAPMEGFDIDQSFAVAAQHHQAGRLQEAEELYRQILSRQPAHADALHLLGVIARQKGRFDLAVNLIRQALALKPNNPQALSNLAVALTDGGKPDEAIQACRRSLALMPGNALAHFNLGNALKIKGQFDGAVAEFRQAISLRPQSPEAYNNLGNALQELRRLPEAIAAFGRAIAQRPNYPQAYSNLGIALTKHGQLHDAIVACRKAISLQPTFADAWFNLGNALRDSGQVDEAVAAFQQVVSLDGAHAGAYNNLGHVLNDKGMPAEAVAAYEKSLAFKQTAEAQWNLALSLLLKEDFEEGWKRYEWRWKCSKFSSLSRDYPQPLWNGESLVGRTLFIHSEQGFGDTMQFVRYVPFVLERGGRVILECQPPLKRLLQASITGVQIIGTDEATPAFDVYCPIMSLPRVMWEQLPRIPNETPYLKPPPELVAQWRRRMGDSPALKVGLAWAGSVTHPNDRCRSMSLAQFTPLAALENVEFYSLQKGPSEIEASDPPAGMRWTDWMKEIADYADTAGLVANLDLVIAVDTSVVHLAGAMAKPAWVLLPFAPDWRWGLGREDCLWYPPTRVFRQEKVEDWAGVMQRVREALKDFSRRRA